MAGKKQPEGEWEKVWNARAAALETILGKDNGMVLHASVPFHLGGPADVVPFPDFVRGMTYATAELTGPDTEQLPNSLGQYELMICTQKENPKAAGLISQLSRYTCDAQLEPGHTMDMPNIFGDKTLRAMLFTVPKDPPPSFDVLGQKCGLLLIIGITKEELAFAQKHGSAKLLEFLKAHDVFPYTIPDRKPVAWLK